MRRGTAALALAAAITVSMTACGSEGPAGPGDADSAGPVTITWWDTSDAANESSTFKVLASNFQKANPGITVTYVNVPFAEAREKFRAAAADHKGAPDVLRADVGWTPGFAAAGYLAPLDGTPAAADTAAFQPELIEQATYDGKLYALPQVTDTLALMYNKELFAKAGISKAPTTWSELKTDAARIKQRTGAHGFAFNPQDYYAMPFLYGEDTDMVDTAEKRITVNSPAAVKGIDTIRELLAAPGVAPLDTSKDAYANIMQDFVEGRVASIIQGPWENANVFAGKAFLDNANLGIATVPAGSSGHPGAPLGGHNLVSYAGSDAAHRAAAQKFMAFMTSANAQIYTAIKNSTLPTRSDAYSPDVTTNLGIAGFRKVLAAGRPRPALPEYTLLYTPLGEGLDRILSGGESTRAGLDAVAAEAAKLVPGYAPE
ncbi:sugar ABC transporter substrate-binding protein [Kitasatospora sp. NE20-6]|uniref:extracellular solute-binding protein n=1 Tax=Kitasatospora sp. NE20-6 TaxID=2859066 RepID=UPI0034DC881E